MNPLSLPRWAVSLADLGLLLLGFFIILYADKPDLQEVARSVRVAAGSPAPQIDVLDVRASSLFEPGEARLTRKGRIRLHQIGTDVAKGSGRLEIESRGLGEVTQRFDAWELAAARAAAAGRALKQAGVPEDRVQITMPAVVATDAAAAQRLIVRLVR